MSADAGSERAWPLAGPRPNGRAPLRLLFLVPFAPRLDAAHGGSQVIAQLIKQLAERHHVAVCYLRAAEEPAANPSLLERCVLAEEVVIPPAAGSGVEQWHFRARVWSQVLAGKPLWAIGRSAAAYGERVQALMREWHPDVVQIEYHIMGQYLPALRGHLAPRVLVQHEPGREAAFQAWRSRQGQGRMMPYFNWLAWRRFERRVIRQVQAVVVFTERDRRAVAQLAAGTPLVRIPFGIELPARALNPLGCRPFNLLFAGNFLHLPNRDAAQRLIGGILPRVLAECPETHLYIVGDHAPSALRQQASENVRVTGYVPEVKPYLDQASLVVVPLRLGGGMRVKVLEALAAGKAVVATRLATEGLDLTDGEQVVLAETDKEFGDAIVALLRSPERRGAIAARARTWACANLRWDRAIEAYEALYHALL
jgi:glycosyltransferase involved in cell wall biosynthesis